MGAAEFNACVNYSFSHLLVAKKTWIRHKSLKYMVNVSKITIYKGLKASGSGNEQ
jgi:hypothetical protein